VIISVSKQIKIRNKLISAVPDYVYAYRLYVTYKFDVSSIY